MFDKDGFIADYIEATRTNDSEKKTEVLSRLTIDEDFDFRKELVNGIIAGLKEKDEDYAVEIEFLQKQLQLLDAAKQLEQQHEDSAGAEGKEKSEPGEVTQDVAADTSADEAKTEVSEADSGGYAPAKEEEEGKSE